MSTVWKGRRYLTWMPSGLKNSAVALRWTRFGTTLRSPKSDRYASAAPTMVTAEGPLFAMLRLDASPVNPDTTCFCAGPTIRILGLPPAL